MRKTARVPQTSPVSTEFHSVCVLEETYWVDGNDVPFFLTRNKQMGVTRGKNAILIVCTRVCTVCVFTEIHSVTWE
jgi:hypothetical protein